MGLGDLYRSGVCSKVFKLECRQWGGFSWRSFQKYCFCFMTGFCLCRCALKPFYCFKHILDLVLAFGNEINNLTHLSWNSLLFSHFIVSFSVSPYKVIAVFFLFYLNRAKSVSQLIQRNSSHINKVFCNVPCHKIINNSWNLLGPYWFHKLVGIALGFLNPLPF